MGRISKTKREKRDGKGSGIDSHHGYEIGKGRGKKRRRTRAQKHAKRVHREIAEPNKRQKKKKRRKQGHAEKPINLNEENPRECHGWNAGSQTQGGREGKGEKKTRTFTAPQRRKKK